MLLSGIQKFSLLDYPGKTSCIVFTLGCNMRCSFCHNSEFVLPNKVKENMGNLIATQAFFNFLETRKGLLQGVSICGGEPTLQKDLYDFCKRVKQMGFLVKLDTNGRDPQMLQKFIDDGLVDYIAMDIKYDFENYDIVSGVNENIQPYKQSIQILLHSGIEYEFRTTVIKGYHTQEQISAIGEMISGAKKYFLQNYRAGKTLDPNFDGKSFEIQELKILQNIAGKYVVECGVRM